MGLDLALGVVVLLAAFRGWLKGFVLQALRIVGLVGSAYLAVPVREQVKPYALQYLPTIRADLVDRLFWWASAAGCYFLIVGVGSLVVALSRRQAFGIAEPQRGDQFAGFGLGLMKGLIVAAFLVSALDRYGRPQFDNFRWASDQTKESFAWDWNERYHPATRMWTAPPVQQFVAHVQKMGLMNPSAVPPEKTVQTASRTPQLAFPGVSPDRLDTSDLDPELARAVESLREQLDALDASPAPNRR
jgi:uncharacterized membrane protein required for colicin V production